MTSEHTPGPWRKRRYDDIRYEACEALPWYRPIVAPEDTRGGKTMGGSNAGVTVAFVYGETDEELEYNVRLIAAAPEMLAVLQRIVADEKLVCLESLEHMEACAIIAKATGGNDAE